MCACFSFKPVLSDNTKKLQKETASKHYHKWHGRLTLAALPGSAASHASFMAFISSCLSVSFFTSISSCKTKGPSTKSVFHWLSKVYLLCLAYAELLDWFKQVVPRALTNRSKHTVFKPIRNKTSRTLLDFAYALSRAWQWLTVFPRLALIGSLRCLRLLEDNARLTAFASDTILRVQLGLLESNCCCLKNKKKRNKTKWISFIPCPLTKSELAKVKKVTIFVTQSCHR